MLARLAGRCFSSSGCAWLDSLLPLGGNVPDWSHRPDRDLKVLEMQVHMRSLGIVLHLQQSLLFRSCQTLDSICIFHKRGVTRRRDVMRLPECKKDLSQQGLGLLTRYLQYKLCAPPKVVEVSQKRGRRKSGQRVIARDVQNRKPDLDDKLRL